MKSYHVLLFSILLTGILAIFSGCSSDFLEEEETIDESTLVVNVTDAKLLATIKELLELTDDDDLTRGKLAELTELDLRTPVVTEVASLTGLEYAVNLTKLDIGATQVTDLSPISGLQKITYLRLNDTQVADLSPISSYTALTYFNANTASNITDISPLSGNAGLQELILRNVPMGNSGMTVIRSFTSLYRLNMRSTGVTDITVLGELMALGALLKTTPGAEEAGTDAELDLRGNEIVSYDPIRTYVENGTAVTTNPATLPDN